MSKSCAVYAVALAFGAAFFMLWMIIEYLEKPQPYVDDGKPIEGERNMIIHCSVVHENIALYSMLNCGICSYKEECKKYMHRHGGKAPYEVKEGHSNDKT